MKHADPIITIERVRSLILLVRGHRVILDSDLAALYGVTTKVLNQAVRRNLSRFPHDFMFRLTREEKEEVVTNCDHLGRLKFSPVQPCAFTEHGAIMLANVLKSERAIEASINVVRAFVGLRQLLATHKELAGKLEELEGRVTSHDERIQAIFEAIRQLLNPPQPPHKQVGFRVKERRVTYKSRRDRQR